MGNLEEMEMVARLRGFLCLKIPAFDLVSIGCEGKTAEGETKEEVEIGARLTRGNNSERSTKDIEVEEETEHEESRLEEDTLQKEQSTVVGLLGTLMTTSENDVRGTVN